MTNLSADEGSAWHFRGWSSQINNRQCAVNQPLEITRLGAPSHSRHADGQVCVHCHCATTTTLNNFQATCIRLQSLDTLTVQW